MPQKTGQVDAVAQVYARSLFELAYEAGGLPVIETSSLELEEIAGLMDGDARFGEFMRSIVIPVERKRETLRQIFGEDRVSDLVLRFLLVLNDKERLGHLPEIAQAFRDLYWDMIGRIDVEATTAKPLEDAESQRVIELIRNAIGKEAVLRNKVDESMIGGLRLRIGDRLIDASVATRLARMRESLTKTGSETARARFESMIEE